MDNKEIDENKKIEDLSNAWQKLCVNQAIISVAIQYKKSQEIINQKEENENSSLSYGIQLINKKVLENLDKYREVGEELNDLLKNYKDDLTEIGEYHDTQIALGYVKVMEEEIKQCKLYKKIYYLKQEEKVAIEKADNSDDEIKEKICNIEDEINKSELRVRRIKPTIRKRVQDKETDVFRALESEEQEVSKEPIKGPRVFNKATRFFMGRINPYKTIKKNVFNNLRNRIEKYENSEERKNIKRVNEKYKEENIIETIAETTKEE